MLASELADSAVNLVLGAIGGFAAAAIAYWFGVKRDIAKLRAELKYERTFARIDKRDQVLDEIWKAVQSASAKAAVATAMVKQFPDFRRMREEEVQELLESSSLTERQRRELLESSDRAKYYRNAIFWHELHDARGALYDLNKQFLESKIYIPSELSNAIAGFIKMLNDMFISYEIWYESKDPELMKRARGEIKQAEALAEDIESRMRSFVEESERD